MQRSDDEVDRLLARGRPAGPELDRMWDKLSPRVKAQEAPSPTRYARLMRWLALGAVPVAAAAGVFLIARPTSDSNIEARSAGDAAVLEASCGASAPCRVGQELGLRFHATTSKQYGYVFLVAPGGALTSVALAVGVGPGFSGAVPASIVPEHSDVGTGVELRAFLDAKPLSQAEARARVEAPTSSHTTLRLQVAP